MDLLGLRSPHLIDAQAMAAMHPDSFETPSRAELARVTVRSIVKIGVTFDRTPEGAIGERFWCRIFSKTCIGAPCFSTDYMATVDNDLEYTQQHGLAADAIVTFGPENILAIAERKW